MNWRLLILSTVLVSILVFLQPKATLVLAKVWFWLWWLIGHSIAGVSDLQPHHGDQLVPLANLLTVVLVSFLVVFMTSIGQI